MNRQGIYVYFNNPNKVHGPFVDTNVALRLLTDPGRSSDRAAAVVAARDDAPPTPSSPAASRPRSGSPAAGS